MGMYTTFKVTATVKRQYREQLAKLYELQENTTTSTKDDVKSVGLLDIFSDLITGKRWEAFIYGGWNGTESVKFDKDTGRFELETDIKNYHENIDPTDSKSPFKEKRSSELFYDVVPILFEEENFELSEHYEEDAVPFEYKIQNNELVCVNSEEWTKAQRERYGYF